MINLQNLKKIKRSREVDIRDFEKGIRADRNEKVENWPRKIFSKIFNKIKNHEFTSYYDTSQLSILENKIGKFFKINRENFVINHGGDGVIKEFLLLNYKKNLKVLINGNNYGMYSVYLNGLKIKKYEAPYLVNLKKENLLSLDYKFFNENIKKSNIVIITFPNVVSNFDFRVSEINHLCKKYSQKKFFIDESYFGFNHPTCLPLIKKNKNLFVLRSITKTFGLASSRVGFLISHRDSIKPFKALETPYPLSLFSGKCLEFFIKNKKILNEYNRKVKIGREYFCKHLKMKNYLVNNGGGLSILIYFSSKNEINKIFKKLIENKIYTKTINIGKFNFLRITCAPKNTMDKILKFF